MVSLSLKAIIGLVLVSLIIFSTLGFWVALWNLFFGSPYDEYSEANYKRLITEIHEILDDPNSTIETEPYYIKNGLSLMGFFNDKNHIGQTCGLWNRDRDKPVQCGGYSCLCICEEGGCHKKVFECERFEKVSKMLADPNLLNEDGFAGKPFESFYYFIIYGSCNGEKWKAKPLVIKEEDDAGGLKKLIFSKA